MKVSGSRTSLPSPLLLDDNRPVSPGCPTAGNFISFREQVPLRRRSYSLPATVGENSGDATPPQSAIHGLANGTSCKPSLTVKPGQYVAFALATDTIADRYPTVSEAYEAVAQFPVHRYIGLVTDAVSYTSENGTGQTHEIIINYVASVPPPASMPHFVEDCLPISPTSTLGLDDRAPPLQTTVLFPSVGAEQWTTLGTRLSIERLHTSSLRFALRDDEFSRFEEIASEDSEAVTRTEQLWTPQETELVHKFQVPDDGLPAEIWLDVRAAGVGGDPIEFVDEIGHLESIINHCDGDSVNH